MRSITLIFAVLALLSFAGAVDTSAQSKKTIILVRHAEKDESATADKNDPELSPEGKQRAARLLKIIKKYKPGAVYSTNYKRTRNTVEPIAEHRKKSIKPYDPRAPQTLVDEIMNSPTKRFVVSGHSNTVPGLANLLVKKELFKQLDESEYGTIWVIRIKKNRQPRIEVLSY